jgi:hypothetical protein
MQSTVVSKRKTFANQFSYAYWVPWVLLETFALTGWVDCSHYWECCPRFRRGAYNVWCECKDQRQRAEHGPARYVVTDNEGEVIADFERTKDLARWLEKTATLKWF